MIDISLAGLVGAIVGTAVAALAYGRLVGWAERAVWGRGSAPSTEEPRALEQERSMLRRAVLAIDVVVLAGIGYSLGVKMWG